MMAAIKPMSASAAVMTGLDPSARSVAASFEPSRRARPMICPAMSRPANAAIPPNTVNAIDSGRSDRCAFARVSARELLMTSGVPAGITPAISFCTAASLLAPPATFTAVSA